MGCSQMRMPVPKELDGKTPAMPVTTKKAWHIFDITKISFGPFAASKFKMGWDRSGSTTVDVYAASDFSKKYSFALKQGTGDAWQCDCAVKAMKKEVKGKLLGGDLHIPIKNKTSLNCTFTGSSSDSVWTLAISKNANETDAFTGELSGGGEKFQIESVEEVDGQRFKTFGEPSGYVYRIGETLVGAAETLGKGRVWISPDSTGTLRPQLALASTALIVFQGVLGSVDKK